MQIGQNIRIKEDDQCFGVYWINLIKWTQSNRILKILGQIYKDTNLTIEIKENGTQK